MWGPMIGVAVMVLAIFAIDLAVDGHLSELHKSDGFLGWIVIVAFLAAIYDEARKIRRRLEGNALPVPPEPNPEEWGSLEEAVKHRQERTARQREQGGLADG